MSLEKDLNRLRRLPENKVCPNCLKEESLGHTAVCMTYKTFICGDCKSAHQSFSHRTKSVSFSNWTAEEVKSLGEKHGGGNRMALATYLFNVPEGERPGKDATLDAYKRFIERAYIQKLFMGEAMTGSGSQSVATSSAASGSPPPSGSKERKRRHKHERSSSAATTPKPSAASDAWDVAEPTPATPALSSALASSDSWENPDAQGRSRRSKDHSSRRGSSKTRRESKSKRDRARSTEDSAAASEASPALSGGRSFCETQAPSHVSYGAAGGDFSFGPVPPMAGQYGSAVSTTVTGGSGSLHVGHASNPWQSPPVARRAAPLQEHGPEQLTNPWAQTLHPAFPHAWSWRWPLQSGHAAQPVQGQAVPVSAAELSRLGLQEADFATNPWAGEVALMLGAVASQGVSGVPAAPRAAQVGYALQATSGSTPDLLWAVRPRSELGAGRWQGLAPDLRTSKAFVGAW